jgi:quercetin dioxygenase-like cupin family protein
VSAVAWQREVELHAGQAVNCPLREEHWHRAAPDSFIGHLAMLDNADDPATTTTWLQHVTDDDYRA